MNIEFMNFWDSNATGHLDSNGIDRTKNFLLNLFRNALSDESQRCQLQSHFFEETFFGQIAYKSRHAIRKLTLSQVERNKILYGHSNDRYKIVPADLNVWYTSENRRPPLDIPFDIYLSHDLDPYDGRNIYLPFWATQLGNSLEEAKTLQEKLLSARDIKPRNGICAVISNPEPIRMAFIKSLAKHHRVDIYGAFGIPLKDKHEVMSRYRINICFENSESPGYVTEKPIQAWQAGCIPVWRGIDQASHLNPNAIVNVTELGFQEAINKIDEIMTSEEVARRMSNSPILRKAYNFDQTREHAIYLSANCRN